MMFNIFKKKQPPRKFPPVPDWKPAIQQPMEKIVDRFLYYTGGTHDFAVFEHGTCALLPDNLTDQEVVIAAKEILSRIYNFHPDMNPTDMDDGNILIRYNHPAFNVVLSDIAQAHWGEIDRNHQRALVTSEVLITPLGNNIFDDFGKKVLFGRCYMFMDAQSPNIVKIVRKRTETKAT
ncbi:MAG: hypothetical protein V2B19_16340 [Pseudomonadota bacterium]